MQNQFFGIRLSTSYRRLTQYLLHNKNYLLHSLLNHCILYYYLYLYNLCLFINNNIIYYQNKYPLKTKNFTEEENRNKLIMNANQRYYDKIKKLQVF